MNQLSNINDILALRDRGAVFYVSHSGGKDSQAMYLAVSAIVPRDQIVVVHADLGRVEWDGTQHHIRTTINHQLNVVRAVWKDGSRKTLLDMVARRAQQRPDAPAWPSSAQRYCTSDLKRGPIEKFIRGDLKARGSLLAVNCMGLRAQESPNRAKKATLQVNSRLSKAGREVHDWLPIHAWLDGDVFGYIDDNDQQPHPAYALGNDRLSCVFCIFGSAGDLQNGADQRPELAREYLALEESTGSTMFHKAALADRITLKEIA
mgnify:FL=1